jgi:hypothetical protein
MFRSGTITKGFRELRALEARKLTLCELSISISIGIGIFLLVYGLGAAEVEIGVWSQVEGRGAALLVALL